ncbi:hypothetical protein DPJ78_23285 [Salmonella enterica subsp. enterica serovar Panama]|nr:hypothetical protein [Salmonella enterica subsp. enterica serovar Panama]EBW6121885.1 hypothetical protein [Salmonella enterica subsp. enterica serovar Panama]
MKKEEEYKYHTAACTNMSCIATILCKSLILILFVNKFSIAALRMAPMTYNPEHTYTLDASSVITISATGTMLCNDSDVRTLCPTTYFPDWRNFPNGGRVTLPFYASLETDGKLLINGQTTAYVYIGSFNHRYTRWGVPPHVIGLFTGYYDATTDITTTDRPTITFKLSPTVGTNEPGVHTSTLKFRIIAGSDTDIGTPTLTHTFTSYIIFRVKDNKPVPPDTPTTCVVNNQQLNFAHGSLNMQSSKNHTITQSIQISCDGAANATLTIGSGNTNAPTRVSLTNNGAADLSILGPDGTWTGEKNYNLVAGLNNVSMRSVIVDAAPGATSTGSTVLKFIYN